MVNIRIFCNLCKEYILKTSDKFVIGKEYNGSMFKPTTTDKWRATMFRTSPEVRSGSLLCPRCTGLFVAPNGVLITEHGRVYPHQKSIDTRINIVHQDGPMKGNLKHIIDSKEAPVHRLSVDQYHSPEVSEVETFPKTINNGDHDLKASSEPEQIDEFVDSGKLICDKCGKEYSDTKRGRFWYDKHVEKGDCVNE